MGRSPGPALPGRGSYRGSGGFGCSQFAPALEHSIEPVLILLLFATFLAVPLIEVGKAFRDIRFLTTTRLILAAAAALLLPALTTTPALAHDSLSSTEPARDAVLDTAPATVSLTLSEAPLNSAQLNTSILKVTDSTGKTLSDDNVQVTGDTLSTAITAGQPGPYTVQWRAVSSDGHPIEGTYTFTVQTRAATATPSQPAAAAVPSASAAPAVTSGTTPVPPAPRPDDSNALLVTGIGAAVIAGLIALARRKENRPQP